MKKTLLTCLLGAMLVVSLQAQTSFKTLNYLYSISGSKTVSGQHNDQKDGTTEATYTNKVNEITGKFPALWSGDFLFHGNSAMRWAITYEAERQWKAGAMVNLMWHACPPNQGNVCNWDGGLLSHLSDAQWNELITNGTALNNSWKSRMDEIAVYLQYLEDKGVEVLFRPLHEMNQGVFWWAGRTGPNGTRRLYQITHDYLQNTKGLSNLIWVWDVQDLSTNYGDYNPGANYFDVAALDVYGDAYSNSAYYNALVAQAGNKPVGIGECFVLPSASVLQNQPRWSFFMNWSYGLQQNNSDQYIRDVYNNAKVITRDELPGWISVPTNLATGKAVTVSSTEVGGNVAANAVDGSYTSRWSSLYADPQWLQIDLGGNYSVTRVKLTWEAAYGKDYLVQISSDAANWTTLKTVAGNTSVTNDHTGLSGTGRYIRLYGTARATTYGYSLYEVEVYGAPVVVNQAPVVSLTAPSNNASFSAPATITLSANAMDNDGTISKVDFYNGTTYLGTDVTAPYTFVWNTVAAGTYSVSAKAVDNSNVVSSSNTATVVVSTPSTNSSLKVVAYVANWIDLTSFANSIDYKKITHLNVAFENPNSSGDLTFNSGDNALIQKAHANNVKVFVSIGGGSASEDAGTRSTYFNLISDANRASFVSKLAVYLQSHNFDGLDVDLEGPAINGDYGKFIADLSNALKPMGKGLSAALSQGYGGANVPSSTFTYFDWINIMAYDAAGPWAPNSPGQHSSFDFAKSNVDYWIGRGLSKNKAVLGVPFYGYGFASASGEWPYSSIVNTYAGAENTDQAGNIIYYNGIPTMKAKVNYAFDQQLGGIMIWELSEDAIGAKSLLLAIDQVVKSRGVVVVPDNLAKGKSVVVSSTEAGVNVAGNLVDGSYSTRWSSMYTDNEWLNVDLGNTYLVNQVKISWEAAYGKDFTIQVSNDASNWTTIKSVTGNTSLSNDFTGLSGTGRYVRINGSARGSVYGYSLYELEVYGVPAVPVNLATGKPVVVSSTEAGANVAANAVDGLYASRWSSLYTDAQWLYVDLGNVYAISRVKISWEAAYGKDYTVQVSNDAANWTTMKSITGNTSLMNEHTGLAGSGRYLRINGTARGTTYGYSIYELEVYGTQVGTNQLPSVSITAPSSNASYVAPASINISANATDNDGSISKIDFYSGSTLIGSDNTAPYSFVWNSVGVGNFSLIAKATDNSGSVATSSAITVTVTPAVVNQSPTCTITGPANGSSYSLNNVVNITANATDVDGSISKVEFYNGATLLGSDNTAPYSFAWTVVSTGTFSVTAKAFDNANASTLSSAISINVSAVNVCVSLPTYVENGGYTAGSKVKNVGRQYECKPYPYSGWCNGASWAYGPGVGAYWQDAWIDKGTCTARVGDVEATPTILATAISLHPNPASESVILSVESSSSVRFFDARGNVVLFENEVEPNGIISIRILPSGIYYVQIDNGVEVVTQKLIKN